MSSPDDKNRWKAGFWRRFAIFFAITLLGAAGSVFGRETRVPMETKAFVAVVGAFSIALLLAFLVPLLDRRGKAPKP